MKSQTKNFLINGVWLSDWQHGKGISCTDKLTSGNSVDIVYIDIPSAFDNVNHLALLHKFERIEVLGFTLNWINIWLTRRRHR